jgi:hypothetical protein
MQSTVTRLWLVAEVVIRDHIELLKQQSIFFHTPPGTSKQAGRISQHRNRSEIDRRFGALFSSSSSRAWFSETKARGRPNKSLSAAKTILTKKK